MKCAFAAGVCAVSGGAASITRRLPTVGGDFCATVCYHQPRETPTFTTAARASAPRAQMQAARAGHANARRESRPACIPDDLPTSPLSDDEECAEAPE